MKKMKITALLLTAVMTIAMAVPAAADTYVPSVTAKTAPTVGSVTSEDGTTTYDSSALTVTPLADADSADDTVKESLNEAYADIAAADDLGDLVDLTTVLSAFNTANSTSYVTADLTVTDLFYVSATGAIASALAQGEKVAITLTVDSVSADDLVIVLQYADGTWVALDESDYTVNEDGTITVVIDSECTLAVVTATDEAAEVGGTGTTSTTTETTASSDTTDDDDTDTTTDTTDTTSDETTSPQTGETVNYGLIAMAAVLVFGAAICFGSAKKHA